MCGIAGIIGNHKVVCEQTLKKLALSLSHRGPDDEGIEIITVPQADRAVGLVHRRLSIIDLSPAGHQPMKDEATGNWITFNGEIYNYREIRRDLEANGVRFLSQSDTEIILKAYAAYGVECLSKLRGMFAFALFDAKNQKLFCAIDRFGIKPLYVYHNGTTFAFSSEVQALVKSGVVLQMLDHVAVESFLSFGAVQAPHTIIKDVQAMLPAHYLIYELASNRAEIKEYWKPHPVEDDRPFKKVLEDTVRYHLVSDVPVGLFLSGGVDSSALAILANRVAGPTLDSFSVTFKEKEYAEGHLARMIGEQFCARHHEIKLGDADLESLLPGALDAQDQPTIDGVNAYCISKAVHDTGIKVVLSGQGGDEVFGGYSTFRRIPQMVQWWPLISMMPQWKRNLLARMIGQGSVARTKMGEYLLSDGDVRTFYAIARQLFSPSDITKLFILNHDRGLMDSRFRRHDNQDLDLFSRISLLELRGYLANTLLRDGDVMSMAHGLEVRVPYLDHVLLGHVMSIPASQKVSRTLPKPLLLAAVRDEMPREIYDRKKMGFTFPWEVWLRGRLHGQVDQAFHDRQAAESARLDLAACQDMWNGFLNNKGGITWSRVWGLYVLLRWVRTRIL